MPHSHGGGSSGGFGGGGGGGSFRSGSSASGPRYSKNRPFPGAHRYYYINPLGARCYFYYAGVPQRKTMASVLVPLIIALLVVVIISTVLLATIFPRKLGASRCKYNGTLVDDPDDFFSETDEQTLKASLTAFYKKTGIEPYVYAFDTKRMPELETVGKYLSADLLEAYAYDKYLDLFDDEGHYLVVIAFETDSNGTIAEWMWIDMAGDNTDRIIDDYDFIKFQKNMNRNFDSKEMSKAVAVSKAFDESTKTVMKINSVDMFSIGISLVVIVFLFIMIIYSLVKSVQQVKEFNAYCDYRDKNGGKDFIEGEDSGTVNHGTINSDTRNTELDSMNNDSESSGSDLFD